MTVSEPDPVPPTMSSCVCRSCIVLTLDACQATHRLTSLLRLPSQENSRASNCVPTPDSSGSIAMPRPNVPMTVPSFGAMLKR